MGLVSVVLGVIVAGLAIPFAGVASLGAKTVAQSIDELPEELEARPLAQRSTLLDADGNVLATLYDENRVTVALDQISPRMIEAIVAIEDYRFFQHGALDLKGTVRALVTNQASNSVVQGGSTLTQQMVKLTLITQAETDEERKAATDETYARKLRELRYAIAIEEKYSKEWILERYLNIAYFGDGAYGVQAAARHFFNKNAKQLNLREAAMLAGLVQSPSAYDPTRNPERARERRNVVLDRMAQLNVIEREQADKAKSRRLGLDVQQTRNGCVNSRAPFFCDYVVRYLMEDPALGETRAERKELLYTGGLTVRTTLDVNFQDAADEAVSRHVYPTDQAIGALAMVEPGSGHVKAVAQSRPMGTDRAAGQTFLNYVVDKKYGDANGFQAGSTFKAFVLAAAINQGIPLNTKINSPQSISIREREFTVCDDQPYASSQVWSPKNSTGSGTFDLYRGTTQSVNTFFAQLTQRTGICEPFELAQAMGITLDNPASQMVPSFALGVTDVSPLQMAAAYATFAARGKHCETRPVTAIEDLSGNTLKTYADQCRQVLPSAVADAVNDVLKGVTAPGGFAGRIAPSVPSAGKTGTTNSGMAVWFVGYTPQIAAASMIAGANEQGHWLTLVRQTVGGIYRASASGSGFAGPIWGDAMRAITPYLDPVPFETPARGEIAGFLTPVPSTHGMSIERAQQVLEDAGFTTSVGNAVHSPAPKDTVARTNPTGGTMFGAGDLIVIHPSLGPEPKKKKKKKQQDDDDDDDDDDGRSPGRGRDR